MKQASARQQVSKFQNQFGKDIYQVIFSENEPPILTRQGGACVYLLVGLYCSKSGHIHIIFLFSQKKRKKKRERDKFLIFIFVKSERKLFGNVKK
jgi:hypothetical protein